MKKIKSHAQRVQIIRDILEDTRNKPNAGNKRLIIRGKPEQLVIISLPIDVLMYRLDNARTRRQQLRHIRNHPDLPPELFKDPEMLKAQEAQEEILLEMVLSTKDFIDDLVNRGQEDPAIITYDGYLVNGNRRTAALRYIDAEFVDCVVLPTNFSKKEIFDLELDLQISQDFKEPYHWINELIDIEQGLKDKAIDETEEEIARKLHIDMTKFQAKIRMKLLVDNFLTWRGLNGQYDYEKLDDAEQDFIELEKETRKPKFKNNPALSEQAKKAVFTIIDEKPKEGRSYSWIRDLFRYFDQVYNKLKENIEVKAPVVSKHPKKESLVDIIAGNEASTNQVVDVFPDTTPEAIKNKSTLLQEIIQDVKAASKEIKDAEAVYSSISEALREMQGLSIDKHTAKIDQIYKKLIEINKISSSLLSQAEKYKKSK